MSSMAVATLLLLLLTAHIELGQKLRKVHNVVIVRVKLKHHCIQLLRRWAASHGFHNEEELILGEIALALFVNVIKDLTQKLNLCLHSLQR